MEQDLKKIRLRLDHSLWLADKAMRALPREQRLHLMEIGATAESLVHEIQDLLRRPRA